MIEAANTLNPASRGDTWYRIRFDSGKTGYLNADTLRSQIFVDMRYQDARADLSRFAIDGHAHCITSLSIWPRST